MALTKHQIDDFTVYARRPETWLFGSRQHLAVFQILSDRLDSLRLQPTRALDEFAGCHNAAYLHAGLAIETAVKAALVANDPNIFEGKKVEQRKFGPRGGHAFAQRCSDLLGQLSQIEMSLLKKLEEYVVWAGKYPFPKREEVLYDQDSMHTLRNAPMDERELICSLVDRLQSHVASIVKPT